MKTRMEKDQGIPVSFSGSVMRDAEGALVGIVGVAKDMQEIRSMNQELKETKAFLGNIIRSIADCIIVLDYDGKIKMINQAAIDLLGYEGEEALIGRAVGILTVTEEEPFLFKPADFNRLMHENSIKNVEIIFRTKKGDKIPMLLSGSILRNDQGKLLGIVLVSKDITKLKKVEKMKDEFLSTVSHELRTPLAIIQASIANLKDGIAGPLAPKQAEVVEMSDRNCSRLSRLIEDLLDLSRLESGESKFHYVYFSLRLLIHEVVGVFRVTTKGAKELVEEVPDTLPDLTADREGVARVLTNLLQNAVHFAKKKVVVKAAVHGGKSEMTVSIIDDGCGITKEEQGELFNKFVQLHRPEGGEGYRGTGLGLAMCKNIVEKHGGKIWVESEAGLGAAFHWTIPMG